MQIQTIKTTEDIVAEETGLLMFRVIALRAEVEREKAARAKAEADLANLKKESPR